MFTDEPTSRYLSGCPKCVNIAHRRLAEKTLVLSIELAGALIPNLEGCARGVEFLREHLLARSVKPKLLLKLERTHGCEAAEVMVEGRSTHPGHRCKIIHVQCLLVVLTQPIDRLCCSMALVSQCSNGTQAISLCPLKESVDDLSLEQLAKERDILRRIEKLNHAAALLHRSELRRRYWIGSSPRQSHLQFALSSVRSKANSSE
jgi:hypothetical protein